MRVFSKMLLVFGCLWMSMGSNMAAAGSQYNAVVDQNYQGDDGGMVNQVRTYKTVKGALDSATITDTSPYVIFIKNGRYYEKLKIDKPAIHLIGEDENQTILTYDASSGTLDPNGKKYGTSGSGSIIVRAANFQAENLTIENGFDYVGNSQKAKDDPTRNPGSQAVALKLEAQSDKAIFRNVKILGYQDTLYTDAGRSYFVNCYIAGNVDFIFGAGQAVFSSCDIVSRLPGYITAASTKGDKKYGMLIINSRLTREDQVADNSVYLGRPRHPGGNPAVNSEVTYINCSMDNHISAKGWSAMSGAKAEDARFYEYGSTGTGAKTSASRKLLSGEAAADFSLEHVLDGWNPEK